MVFAPSVPEQLAVAAGRLHGSHTPGQPACSPWRRRQAGVGDKRLPDGAEHGVLRGELVAHGVVRQALLRGHQAFVAANGAVHAGKNARHFICMGRALRNSSMLLTTCCTALLVEVAGPAPRRRRCRCKSTIRPWVFSWPYTRLVRQMACKQVVVLQRLVQVHGLQDRRIETGEQLAGDDDRNFSGSAGSRKRSSSFSSASLSRMCAFHSRRVGWAAAQHDGAGFGPSSSSITFL
jgi:hypothetical protein